METELKPLCVICMREGSKGVVGKNSVIIKNKPLFQHTIEQAIKSKIFENIVISTDSKKMAKKVETLGLDVWFERPKNLALDSSPKLPVIIHALKQSEKYFKKKFSVIFDLDVTSPLREVSDIKKAFEQFKKSKATNLISICKARKNPYFNMLELKGNKFSLVKKTSKKIYRRQDAPKVFEMNASIYIWKREYLVSKKPLISKFTTYYEMPEDRSIDIDSPKDLKYVSFLMDNKNG